ncbi:vanadium-dependent haloperoxidase [Leifsonia sp. YIM 134122]|uniref:Vanadium-dependent haloperoxidase n=1 Tax=Leifsonia stereocauli TaxID=3134136 RepID=A0ABU9VZ20_9MICO
MRIRSIRALTIALVATAGLLAPASVVTTAQADPRTAADPAVITEWNAIAERTVFIENLTPIPTSGLYFGFVSIAMYDAVVAIEGGFEPYATQPRSHRHASSEAAAATAAYIVLRHYFPSSAENLTDDYRAALANSPKGVGRLHGIVAGAIAALNLIRARQDDGRDAAVTLDVTPAPGVWRPTPPGRAPMLAPWLGFVDPLLLESPTQFPLPGPDAVDTDAYAQDFAEVKAYGASEDSARTEKQTETALFFNYNAVLQYRVGLSDLVTRGGFDIATSARAYALLSTAIADAQIACWRAKYDYAFWRPVTAIPLADTDGNEATEADAEWAPLAVTPPYPDYLSGHACVTGAVTGTLGHLFGDDSLDLNLFSGITGTTRHYDTVESLDADTMNARIWLGLHFRKAMTDGNALGHAVSDWSFEHYFQPAG